MIYVISDIHGCCDKYIKMLDMINMSDKDTLYVLGDVIDRGERGVDILREMKNDRRVVPIIGNHESMALGLMRALRGTDTKDLEIRYPKALYTWMLNGGVPTLRGFAALTDEEKAEITEYIDSFSIYENVSAGGRNFHLSHTLPEYDPERDVHDASYLEFIWGEPDYGTVYDENTIFVTGHTPTALIDPEYGGRIWQGNNHIAVDCGAAFENGCLGCICLDTLEEYYVY